MAVSITKTHADHGYLSQLLGWRLLLAIFVTGVSFIAFQLYLRKMLQHLDPSKVVPAAGARPRQPRGQPVCAGSQRANRAGKPGFRTTAWQAGGRFDRVPGLQSAHGPPLMRKWRLIFPGPVSSGTTPYSRRYICNWAVTTARRATFIAETSPGATHDGKTRMRW